MSTGRILTVKQAAERLGLSDKKVYGLLKQVDGFGNPVLGHYKPVPGSRCVRIGEHHLEAFLDAAERKASESPAQAMIRKKNPAAQRKLVYVRKG
jgi:excisionase family DNA binding protein